MFLVSLKISYRNEDDLDQSMLFRLLNSFLNISFLASIVQLFCSFPLMESSLYIMLFEKYTFWCAVCNISYQTKIRFETERLTSNSLSSASTLFRCLQPRVVHCAKLLPPFSCRSIATAGDSAESSLVDSPPSISNVAPRIKFKRLDKTARHIMQASIYSCYLWMRILFVFLVYLLTN